MKKYLLFATILLQTTFLFGQSTQWGPWNKVDCYKGISFRCRVKDYNSSAKQYHWEYEIKNSYSQKVALTFDIANTSGDGRTTINAGGVDKSWCLAPTNSMLYFTFSKLCFHFPNGFDQCSEYPSKNYAGFAECDNGIPKYVKAGNNNNNQNSSSNNSNNSSSNQGNTITHQQNDPTFDRNNASFQDYYKRAMAAKDAGNYDQAENLLNSAISVAVNDAQRDNAQGWLDEVQKAKANANNQAKNAEIQKENARRAEEERQRKIQQQKEYNNSLNQAQQNISNKDYKGAIQSYGEAGKNATTKGERNVALTGVLASGTIGIFDEIAKAKEAKRQKQEQERLEQSRIKQEREQEAAKESEEMEGQWKFANQYADKENAEGYQKAIELMLPYANADRLTGSTLNTIGHWYWELKDYKNAKDWYTKAYIKGDASASRNLGVLYFNGMGVEKSKGVAISYFQKACEKGLENDCAAYKMIRTQLELSIEQNETKYYFDIYNVAESYFSEKNYTKAAKYYKKTCEVDTIGNHWNSTLKVADMYFNKNQLNNYDSAAKWYAISINFMENDKKQNNIVSTKKWFDDKYTDALFNYVTAIQNTNGKLAIDACLKAVRDGYTGAYVQIGVIYELGKGGIEKDWKLAADYYEKDAEEKSAKAMYYLGQLYEKGGPNLEKDKSKSKKWFKMACKADKKYCD